VPHVLFRHAGADANYNAMRIAPLDHLSTGAVGTLRCERLSFAGSRGLCLQADRGVFTTYKAVLFDRTLTATGSMKLDGSPSRTKISADGRVGAITVFLAGHAYTAITFSTRTSLVDMASGDELAELEQFATWKDGVRFKSADFNFWGVTFTRDGNAFYATLGTGGKIYLVKGDLGLRKTTVLREGIECPSLSPDNRLIVFKRRVGSIPGSWRLYVLDLATMVERPVAAETQYIDDQVEWLDNKHVLYGVQRKNSGVSDVWISPVDDSGPSRIYLPEASSPIVVR
jgi:dipeptidyl aminopeptidase/acylaminoacyl peptidase